MHTYLTFLLTTYAPTLLSYLLIPPLVQRKPRCRAPQDKPAFPEGRLVFRALQEQLNQAAQRCKTPKSLLLHSSPSRLPRKENSMSSKTSTAPQESPARQPFRKKLARLPKPSASVNCVSRRPGAVTMRVQRLRRRLRLRRPPPLRSVGVPESNALTV